MDDDIDGAASLALLLRAWGHEDREVHDGAAALEVASTYWPQVVLLDLGLPGGLDGFAVAHRLRQEERLRHALLVALTGWGQEEDRSRASPWAGFDQFLCQARGTAGARGPAGPIEHCRG